MSWQSQAVSLLGGAGAFGAFVAVLAPGAVAQDCHEFGKPSYVAKRVVDIGGQTTVSKVYVSGDSEREEITRDGKLNIGIVRPGIVTNYDEKSRSGTFLKVPQQQGGPQGQVDPKMKDKVRFIKEKAGDAQVTKMQLLNEKGQWVNFITVTCRLDGVLLAKEFPVAAPGKVLRGTVKQTDIEVKSLPPELFQVPSDVKLQAQGGKG